MSNRTEYEKTNTVGFYIKLNKKTDTDIIEALGACPNKQGFIKRLIRDYIRDENQIKRLIRDYIRDENQAD